MKTQKLISLMMGIALLVFFANAGNANADTTGEEALFVSSTQPDALMVLDLSGSMEWNPPGDDLTYGSTLSCYADVTNCSGQGCSGGFCGSSKTTSTSYYASNSSCTADTTNCVGGDCANGFCNSSHSASTYYAASSCSVPDTLNCSGWGCGWRNDGYCDNPINGVTKYAYDSTCTANSDQCNKDLEGWKDCKNGFCNKSHEIAGSWQWVWDWGWQWVWVPGKSCKYACTTGGCNTACSTGGGCSYKCTSGGVGCTKACSRLAIAQRSVFNILDDNADGTINSTDEGSLGVRLGYMRFYDCGADDTGGDYSSGCNRLRKELGQSYSSINTVVQAESATGGTPLATALKEAKLYLDYNKSKDAAASCRQKFVILITDGSDTYACSGDGSECSSNRYKNRRETVAKAKALGDAGYKVFVIGFGTAMPPYLRNTLNWAAYYGGTDNPNEANSGSTTAYSIVTATDCAATTPADTTKCCNLDSTACYPSSVTGCTNDASTATAACYDNTNPYPGTSGNSTAKFKATANDPGYLDLSGYAFLAGDADQLVASVKAAMNIIREATYSFSQASIQSSRTADENFVYEGSFQPVSDPFWLGHLRKYQINDDGSVGAMLTNCGATVDINCDAGEVLKATAYTDRAGKIKTYVGGALINFSTSIDKTYFDVTTDAERDAIVGYLSGDPIYNLDNWKLGDVFRSTPITLGQPSAFFEDKRDANNAFATHRTSHNARSTSTLGTTTDARLIVTGANGGMFHAFKTGDMTEGWSFVPPNLLSKLKNIAHSAHPTSLIHQYFVDGPVSGADVWWLTSGTDASGKLKVASDWRTMIVFGEGRGSTDRLWSSSASCDSGLSATYSATYSNYCGYYALNLTNSLSPAYLWRLNTFNATTQAPYMGESWSKMLIGRVLTKTGSTETEKWVGFVGGGYNANACKSGSCTDTRGKGFFVVDLSDGHILWSMTHTTGSASNTRHPDMWYSMPAPPSVVDYDNDGFIDTAYLGDLGGNMWRFKFCTQAMLNAGDCTTSNWTGGIFVDSSSGSIRPIYTGAAVAKDTGGNMWVFWGTGDKVDPTAANAQEYFFAVKDLDRTSEIDGFNDIDLINSDTDTYDAGSKPLGYRIALPGSGQKILAEPTIFGGVAYFTSFTPGNSSDPCVQSGDATLNAVSMTTAAGIFKDSTGNTVRKMVIGSGIASSPVISLKPGGAGSSAADLYITVSGGGLSSASTTKMQFDVPGVTNRTNLLYWRDRRVQ